MRSNDLCLDLVSSFLPLLFLLNTSGIFSCIGVRSDFGDDLGRFSSDLLKETYVQDKRIKNNWNLKRVRKKIELLKRINYL